MAKKRKNKKKKKFLVNFWDGKINFKLPKKWGKWVKL
jgi:hypothetical protein|tara:strand:- start:524 stop:634 length:111 start_codon:yes stop_codon:yes gene_type:complete